MGTEQDSIATKLEELTSRVAALESAHATRSAQATTAGIPQGTEAPAPGDSRADVFWALNTLATQRPDHPSTENGAVMIVGSLNLPTGAPISWQEGAGTEGLFESDWSDLAQSFSALGHPARLEILRHIINGTTSTAELAELDSLGTTGQLHHHLRQLVSTGWVQQQGRGRYEVPAARVVPLLAALMGARR